jgi:mannose-6-phosphate isomerase-like protein (cupin superfamily)
MFKKIITPHNEVNYRIDSIDVKYLLNEGNRAIGFFAGTKGIAVPTQISPQDVCFFILEGECEIKTEDKKFNLRTNEMLLIPKTSAYEIAFNKDTKAITVRI